MHVDLSSTALAKVALFRSLFRGRDDLYARRFESTTTGKSGYAPACANEWVRGICRKPQIKCADCSHRAFLPMTDQVVYRHLSGHAPGEPPHRAFVAGVYPLLEDETCFFLAADFDKAGWQDDAAAFVQACHRLHLPVALERSRSGQGGHVWLFFETALPAAMARRLGSHLLTEAMEARPDIGLDSYDRLFPSQDTMPRGGFGNLIALPLQKGPRELRNSVFLDDDFTPWADQWAFLASVGRLGRAQVEGIVREAEQRGRILGVRLPMQEEGEDEPWTLPASRRRKEPPIAGELPRTLELVLVLADQIYIAKQGLPPGLMNRLMRLAAFQNPEFYRAQSMRLSTYGKPRVITCAEDHPLHLALPRGCLDDVRRTLKDLGVRATLRDERCSGQPLELCFHGELRPEQMVAAQALLAHETGVLAATTAFGKTVVAAWLIAHRGVSTLVLVHRQQLLDQWIERLSAFLGLPASAIGRIGGGRRRPNGRIDVALIQSLVHKGVVADQVADYGQLIVDECHHLPAQSFEQVARRTKARFVVGLSATVERKNGHHPIIFMQCGPVRHRVNAKAQAVARPFEHRVLVRPTAFQSGSGAEPDARVEFQALVRELVDDQLRNRRICDDVAESVQSGRSPLVLTERTDHLERLAQLLAADVRHLVVLRAGAGKKRQRAVAEQLAAIPRDEARVILATGRHVGEGFDDARLDTLFLTLPVSWRGTIAQYAGRLHRLCEGKREVRIYDYADLEVPMLARMFERRCRIHWAPTPVIARLPPEGARTCLKRFCAAFRRSATRSCCRRAPFPGGRRTCPCPASLHGSATTRAVCAGWSRTAWTRRKRASSYTSPGRWRPTQKARTGRAARPKRSCTAAWRPCRKRGGASASTPRCRSLSMAWGNWRSISCATTLRTPVSPWNSTATSILPIRPPTAATAARTCCCKKTATSCYAFLPRTSARNWTGCSTPF
ncbi:MAG: restriction endonuclease subunit R [Betaproteobacteria bacterium]|nr:restriction endonuclease subunit R [Betaproteobacteria bacterium]